MKQFKACHVRARRVDGVAGAVQEVEGLKRVAAVLRGSGLVQVDEGGRTFGMHQLLQQAVGRELGGGGSASACGSCCTRAAGGLETRPSLTWGCTA